MATGTVRWFSDKGFGFIAPDNPQSDDLFVHHDGVTGERNGSLVEGARVTYDTEPTKRRAVASNVELT